MRTTQRHPYEAGHVRLGGRIERAQPGARLSVNGIEYDHKFVASTELMASDRGVIFVDAWDWKRYMQRPRWIANHDLSAWSGKLTDVSLGRGVHVAIESGLDKARVGPSGKALVVYVRYASTPFARQVKTLYDEGGLDDVSVRWDWKTEQTRNPYQEEVEKYGEELAWVCEYAELVELSAVLLGADAGAQVVRGDVVAAFERCCQRGLRTQLPDIERLVRGRRTTTVAVGRAESVDINAAAESLAIAKTSVDTIEALHRAIDYPREELMNAITEVGNLAAVKASPPPEDDEEPEPNEAAVAFAAVNDALAHLDLARRDVAPAVRELQDSLTALAAALDLSELLVDRADGELSIDLDAVLADFRDPVEQLFSAYKRLP